ncbi:MAG TPA: hypothetical protein VLE49_09780 [Anaerolineales bacterium]|nr:hypothetical protein [Anaerolineales bacterium]
MLQPKKTRLQYRHVDVFSRVPPTRVALSVAQVKSASELVVHPNTSHR